MVLETIRVFGQKIVHVIFLQILMTKAHEYQMALDKDSRFSPGRYDADA